MSHFSAESHDRLVKNLRNDLGELIIEGLIDPDVQEIQLNEDGGLFFNQVQGTFLKGHLNPTQGLAIIYDVAGLNQKAVNGHAPLLNGELPHAPEFHFKGERFTAQIPPVTRGPSFTLRKKPLKIWTLDDYLETGRITEPHVALLRQMLFERQNIIICGGPNSGKTTVTNALIHALVQQTPDQRIVILEDTPELHCSAKNKLGLLTTEHITMTRNLRQTMRSSPDRILVGEVTGSEALDLLKAWNTGCPGGLATIHANGPQEALQRLADLAMEAGLVAPPVSLIQHTIDAVVFVRLKEGQKGFIESITSMRKTA